MYTCASCTAHSCVSDERNHMPKNCPMHNQAFFEEVLQEYERFRAFYIASSETEVIGYGQWSRLKETVELCKMSGYSRIGLAFCMGLSSEAKVVENVLRDHGLEVVSVICKTGGVSKGRAGVQKQLSPGTFEAMCNPIAQARLLNEQNTQFNIALGLCVGHDSLLYKHCDALVTTLVAKDRVLAHNPAGAIYCAGGYYRSKLAPEG